MISGKEYDALKVYLTTERAAYKLYKEKEKNAKEETLFPLELVDYYKAKRQAWVDYWEVEKLAWDQFLRDMENVE